MRSPLIAFVILFVVTSLIVKLLREQDYAELHEKVHFLESKSPTTSVIKRSAYSPLLEARRQKAREGIEEYLNEYYSFREHFISQILTVYEGMTSLRRDLEDPLKTRVGDSESHSTELSNRGGIRETLSKKFAEIAYRNRIRLYQRVFRHLTDWDSVELEQLVKETRGSAGLVIGALNQKIVKDSIHQLNKARYLRFTLEHQTPPGVKLGASGVMTLIALSAMRSSFVVGALKSAGWGGVSCSPLGPLGSAACATGGFLLSFLAINWSVNIIDEYSHREELRAELQQELDQSFLRFEEGVSASVTGLTRDLIWGREEERARTLRIIDLFD